MNTSRHQFEPGKLWCDTHGTPINAHGGGLLFHNGVYYWFGEHKIEGEAGNRAMVGVHAYSSADLYNWNDEGIVLPVSLEPGHDIEVGCILERPKVIFDTTTGKFVMWFHLERKGCGYDTASSGVAVAERPTGPYRYLRAFRPNAGIHPLNDVPNLHVPGMMGGALTGDHPLPRLNVIQSNVFARDLQQGQMARDMNLFVDDNGRAYHIYSSEENSTLHISELSSDCQAPAGRFVRVFEGRYMEGAAVFKNDGYYYLIASGCTGWEPNAARCAIAKNIMGPWHEMENPCRGVNPQTGYGPEKTFGAQSTYVQKVHGRDDAFIALFDIWSPANAIDGRYVWLPILFQEDRGFTIHWHDAWDLSIFEKQKTQNQQASHD
jgi:hypothetical protein